MENGPDISSLLSTVAQNPQFIRMASSLLEKMPAAEAENKEKQDEKKDNGEFDLTSALSLLGPSLSSSDKKSTSHANRKALLCALKPYLSDKRCAVIDGLLQLEGMAGAFEAVNRMTK